MSDQPFKVRVRATGRGLAGVYVRQQRLDVGDPVQFDVQDERVSALEYFLAAVGGDLVNGFRKVARQRRLEVADVEAVVSAILENPLVFLDVIGETGHPGVKSLLVHVYVSAFEPEQALRDAWSEACRRSPMFNTLNRSVDLRFEFKMV